MLQIGCHLSPVGVISLTGFDGCEAEPGTLFHLYYTGSRLNNIVRLLCAAYLY